MLTAAIAGETVGLAAAAALAIATVSVVLASVQLTRELRQLREVANVALRLEEIQDRARQQHAEMVRTLAEGERLIAGVAREQIAAAETLVQQLNDPTVALGERTARAKLALRKAEYLARRGVDSVAQADAVLDARSDDPAFRRAAGIAATHAIRLREEES